MGLSLDVARNVAHLARIHVEESELPDIANELSVILDFMEQLNEVDIEDVEPMTSVTPMKLRLRKDKVTTGGEKDLILSNAPLPEQGFFSVPKVVE